MKIDSTASQIQPLNDVLKMFTEKSIETSEKLIRANIETKVKSPLPDTLGKNIDTYA
jgi:hypothetical protein